MRPVHIPEEFSSIHANCWFANKANFFSNDTAQSEMWHNQVCEESCSLFRVNGLFKCDQCKAYAQLELTLVLLAKETQSP